MTAAIHLPVLDSHTGPSLAFARSAREPARWPRYLRAVVTAQCPLACTYCHMEGDPARPETARGLPAEGWIALLSIGVELGIRKLKLLGGEPLVRRDLPVIIRAVRERDPSLDLSVITSGAVPIERLARAYDAGLSRCNVSIHGFGEHAFRARGQRPGFFEQRQRFLQAVLEFGRPTKLNYVYRGPEDDDDLGALLDWAAGRLVVVGLLDDLNDASLGPAVLVELVGRQRGAPARVSVESDPHSLPTLRLHHDDGLEVEIKSERLGEHAPWLSCDACEVRARCREGIHALRLTHTGVLRPCMDRPDLGADVYSALREGGPQAARARWDAFVRGTAR